MSWRCGARSLRSRQLRSAPLERYTEGVNAFRPLTGAVLARAIERLQNPACGGKVEAAKEFGVDVTLLIEQIKLSPAERARRMHELAQTAESLRGITRKRQP